MTENEWLTSTDAATMLEFICGSPFGPLGLQLAIAKRRDASIPPLGYRKLQLFACACCWAFDQSQGRTAEWNVQKKVGWGALPAADWARACAASDGKNIVAILRDIVGNPFRPVTFRPTWLTPTVLDLAETAYKERSLRTCETCKGDGGDLRECPTCRGTGRTEDGMLDPHRLAVLSDALEEAGCTSPAILDHLRDAAISHYRGCHVLDLVLGKE